MQQLSAIVHIAAFSVSYKPGKSLAKRTLAPTVSQPGDKLRPTPTATMTGLSFKGGIFKEQQPTFV